MKSTIRAFGVCCEVGDDGLTLIAQLDIGRLQEEDAIWLVNSLKAYLAKWPDRPRPWTGAVAE